MAAYSKILTETDVTTRLAFNSCFLGKFFPALEAPHYRQVLDVEDENGKNWKFALCIRQGQHKKPYISQGTWRPFVVEKQANVGDKVEFSRETAGATGSACRYKIRVMKQGMENEEKEVMENGKKEVKLFGVIIGHR